MNDVLTVESDVVDDSEEFFAPVASDLIDGLIGQYEAMRRDIERVAEFMSDEKTSAALHYFLEGNSTDDRGILSLSLSAEQLFQLDGAVAALTAAYWSKALQLTDVLDMMPQKRRDEWHEQIKNPLGKKRSKYDKDWLIPPLPEFNDENVRNTLTDLLNMRSKFLAERVDGIFQGLSGEHVTNAPEGFGKRMIIAYVNEYGSTNNRRVGLINDLRAVIAKFMGRDGELKWYATNSLIEGLKEKWGEWVTVDGGALRIRLYKKGTAHLEVHPDMAWRLNLVLASIYPLAIPAQFRQRPTRKAKDIKPMQRPIPFAVIEVLGEFRSNKQNGARTHAYYFKVGSETEQKAVRLEVARIIESIGGAETKTGEWEFDYDPSEVLREIVVSGCIPDQRSHQFYPTPEKLARIAVELAEIEDHHKVLEPSAGQGGIADFLPKGTTSCVEISGLNCKVLEAKGHKVTHADFLELHSNRELYDRIVMNPPFDQGRWPAHIEHAAKFVNAGGCLVAILPSSAKTRELNMPGMELEWHGPYHNEFAGTSVSVVMLKATRGK